MTDERSSGVYEGTAYTVVSLLLILQRQEFENKPNTMNGITAKLEKFHLLSFL